MKKLLIFLFIIPLFANAQVSGALDSLKLIMLKAQKNKTSIGIRDSVYMYKYKDNDSTRVLGVTTTGALQGMTMVNLATIGVLTNSDTLTKLATQYDISAISVGEWNTITTGARATDTTITFTGTYLDIQKYNRSLFTCLDSNHVAGKAGSETNYIFVKAHGKKVGDIVYFNSGTLPTASPVLTTGRAYFVQAVLTDSITIAETPNGTVIDLTTTGANIRLSFSIVGFVKGLTISGTTVTATVICDTLIKFATANTFKMTHSLKMRDFEYRFITGVVGCVADGSNPQGLRLLDFPTNAYLICTEPILGTAGTQCTYNFYNEANYMYATAPDLQTRTKFGTPQIPHKIKFIQAGNNLTFRNTAVAGAAAYLEVRATIVPVYTFCKP